MSFQIPTSFTAKVRGVDFPITDIDSLPAASLRKIFEYGLQRISNDAAASAKTDAEAVQFATKRWDNLRAGVIRAAGSRIGDPVKRRALELALAKVKVAPKFLAWIAEVKKTETDSLKVLKIVNTKASELAEKQISVEGNPFTAQAKIDVESAKALTVEDLEIEL